MTHGREGIIPMQIILAACAGEEEGRILPIAEFLKNRKKAKKAAKKKTTKKKATKKAAKKKKTAKKKR